MKCKFYTNKNKIKLEKNNGKIKIIKDKIKVKKRIKDTTGNPLKTGQVCEDLISQRRYLICDVCKKYYECLDINRMKNGVFKFKYFSKTDVVLSNNQSLEGIRWFEDNPNFNLEEVYKNEIIDSIFNSQERYLKPTTNKMQQKVKTYK